MKIDIKELPTIRRKLLIFYKTKARSFPWRLIQNPFLILCTEILLQKTKAEDVFCYWPSICLHLSKPKIAIKSSQFLQYLFSNLGLPKRTNWILNLAKEVSTTQKVPDSLSSLLSIKGVGYYTACATLAFAFNRNEGLVDSNIIRFFERFFSPYMHHDLRQKVKYWLPISKLLGGKKKFKECFWSLLDFCAMVCSVHAPNCNNCFLNIECHFYQNQCHKNKIIKSIKKPPLKRKERAERQKRKGRKPPPKKRLSMVGALHTANNRQRDAIASVY